MMATAAAQVLHELSKREQRSDDEKHRIEYFTKEATHKLAWTVPLVSGEKLVALPEQGKVSTAAAAPEAAPVVANSRARERVDKAAVLAMV